MIGRIVLAIASLAVLAAIARADGYLEARPAKTTVARLLLHEEYLYNGQRVGLDESTDRPATPTQAVPAPQTRTQAERPKYVQHPTTGQWWKQYADGSWEYCAECNAVQGVQAAPVTTIYDVPVATYPLSTYYIYPPRAYSRGVRSGGWSAGFAAGVSGGGT